jgi:hypothetical protein
VLIGAADGGDDEDPGLLRMIKTAPGTVSLASMLAEAGKLTAISSFGLPEDLFGDVAPRVLKEWRDQAMTESPSHLREHPPTCRWHCWRRCCSAAGTVAYENSRRQPAGRIRRPPSASVQKECPGHLRIFARCPIWLPKPRDTVGKDGDGEWPA